MIHSDHRARSTGSSLAEAWTDDEVQAFLAAIADHRWAAPIRLTVFYGLRRSELLGLRWSAVDLRTRTVRIERAPLAMRRGSVT